MFLEGITLDGASSVLESTSGSGVQSEYKVVAVTSISTVVAAIAVTLGLVVGGVMLLKRI